MLDSILVNTKYRDFAEAVTSTIHFTDGVKEREASYLKLLKSSLDDETLSDLRSNIAGLTGSIEM